VSANFKHTDMKFCHFVLLYVKENHHERLNEVTNKCKSKWNDTSNVQILEQHSSILFINKSMSIRRSKHSQFLLFSTKANFSAGNIAWIYSFTGYTQTILLMHVHKWHVTICRKMVFFSWIKKNGLLNITTLVFNFNGSILINGKYSLNFLFFFLTEKV